MNKIFIVGLYFFLCGFFFPHLSLNPQILYTIGNVVGIGGLALQLKLDNKI